MRRVNTALRHALRARLAALAQRLQSHLSHEAAWPETLDDTRGELRLLAPRRLKHRIRKLLEDLPEDTP